MLIYTVTFIFNTLYRLYIEVQYNLLTLCIKAGKGVEHCKILVPKL